MFKRLFGKKGTVPFKAPPTKKEVNVNYEKLSSATKKKYIPVYAKGNIDSAKPAKVYKLIPKRKGFLHRLFGKKSVKSPLFKKKINITNIKSPVGLKHSPDHNIRFTTNTIYYNLKSKMLKKQIPGIKLKKTSIKSIHNSNIHKLKTTHGPFFEKGTTSPLGTPIKYTYKIYIPLTCITKLTDYDNFIHILYSNNKSSETGTVKFSDFLGDSYFKSKLETLNHAVYCLVPKPVGNTKPTTLSTCNVSNNVGNKPTFWMAQIVLAVEFVFSHFLRQHNGAQLNIDKELIPYRYLPGTIEFNTIKDYKLKDCVYIDLTQFTASELTNHKAYTNVIYVTLGSENTIKYNSFGIYNGKRIKSPLEIDATKLTDIQKYNSTIDLEIEKLHDTVEKVKKSLIYPKRSPSHGRKSLHTNSTSRHQTTTTAPAPKQVSQTKHNSQHTVPPSHLSSASGTNKTQVTPANKDIKTVVELTKLANDFVANQELLTEEKPNFYLKTDTPTIYRIILKRTSFNALAKPLDTLVDFDKAILLSGINVTAITFCNKQEHDFIKAQKLESTFKLETDPHYIISSLKPILIINLFDMTHESYDTLYNALIQNLYKFFSNHNDYKHKSQYINIIQNVLKSLITGYLEKHSAFGKNTNILSHDPYAYLPGTIERYIYDKFPNSVLVKQEYTRFTTDTKKPYESLYTVYEIIDTSSANKKNIKESSYSISYNKALIHTKDRGFNNYSDLNAYISSKNSIRNATVLSKITESIPLNP